jgi:hypothetical protein
MSWVHVCIGYVLSLVSRVSNFFWRKSVETCDNIEKGTVDCLLTENKKEL